MRKLLFLFMSILLFASAFTALAAETTFNGQYRVRAWSEYNFDKNFEDLPGNLPSHENGQYDGWFDQRFRLTITHTRSEFLKAVIRFDIVEDTWGQQRNLRINNSAGGNFINLAYIEFTLPTIGTFTVGKFNETYGYGLAFSDEGDGTIGLTGARWANAWGPVAVSVLYAKVRDNVTSTIIPNTYNWDADLYAANLKITPVENHVIELFGGALIDSDASGWGGTGGVTNNSFSYWLNGEGTYSAVVGFCGVAYTGTIADMIDISLEASWIIGHATYISSFPNDGPGPGADPDSLGIHGWNIYADLSYYNDLFRVGVAFIMGSGQHHWWNDISTKSINMNYISQDDFAFNNILVNGGGTNSIYTNSQFGQNNIENITAVKLYFEICPIEKLTLNASVTWAKWTEDVGWNAAGTRAAYVASKGSAYFHPASPYSIYNGYQSWDTSDDLGWELDFGFSYEIMEGLTYSLDVGVLFTGDSWDYEKADGTKGEWGEIWSISNTLLYEF